MRTPGAIALLLALLAHSACVEMEQPQAEGGPIAFCAAVSSESSTRAAGMTTDDAGLRAGGFGVFGCYTGLHGYGETDANSSFMYNQRVQWNGSIDRWEYSPLKYWPGEEGHKVSFFAYAPYSDGSAECISSFSLYQEKTDPWLLYHIAENVDNQIDLLYAAPMLDQTKMAVNERLEFTFKHALACVGDKVNVSTSSTGSGFTLKLKDVRIDYTLTAKGRLVLWNRGSANWSPVMSEDVLTTRSVTLLQNGNETLPWTKTGKGVFCIPSEADGYPQKASIHVTYIVDYEDPSATDVERTASSDLLLKGRIREGETLDINISLTY